MAQVYSTPGVYIEEKNAFPNSVVAVPTAVPAFIGYTEFAMRGKKSLLGRPVRISSFAEFVSFFGGAPHTTYTVAADAEKDFTLAVDPKTKFNLYRCIRWFYANGGGPCYIVSVGNYSDGVKLSELNNEEKLGGLQALLKEQEPTLVLCPDATLLEEAECFSMYQAMIKHCGSDMRSRIAVLDVYKGAQERTYDEDDVVTRFREGVGSNFLAFGAAYYPWVHTTVTGTNELDYTNISNLDELVIILEKEVDDNLAAFYINEKRAGEIKAEIAKLADPNADSIAVTNTLKTVSPTFKEILNELATDINILPPASAMAGIYSLVDNSYGVHKAPANVSLVNAISPTVNLTSENQEDLNLPLNGKAVNAIRSFVGKGMLVWGARTLDGNSQDWRYINVRRTVIMLEQSIKAAAEPYVFQPNDANTWASVKSMISNFLTNVWKQGALVGALPQDAFSVDIGLGVTMTPNDVLDGLMKITVKVAISRPAEFIVITFQQQMQKS